MGTYTLDQNMTTSDTYRFFTVNVLSNCLNMKNIWIIQYLKLVSFIGYVISNWISAYLNNSSRYFIRFGII